MCCCSTCSSLSLSHVTFWVRCIDIMSFMALCTNCWYFYCFLKIFPIGFVFCFPVSNNPVVDLRSEANCPLVAEAIVFPRGASCSYRRQPASRHILPHVSGILKEKKLNLNRCHCNKGGASKDHLEIFSPHKTPR